MIEEIRLGHGVARQQQVYGLYLPITRNIYRLRR